MLVKVKLRKIVESMKLLFALACLDSFRIGFSMSIEMVRLDG